MRNDRKWRSHASKLTLPRRAPLWRFFEIRTIFLATRTFMWTKNVCIGYITQKLLEEIKKHADFFFLLKKYLRLRCVRPAETRCCPREKDTFESCRQLRQGHRACRKVRRPRVHLVPGTPCSRMLTSRASCLRWLAARLSDSLNPCCPARRIFSTSANEKQKKKMASLIANSTTMVLSEGQWTLKPSW